MQKIKMQLGIPEATRIEIDGKELDGIQTIKVTHSVDQSLPVLEVGIIGEIELIGEVELRIRSPYEGDYDYVIRAGKITVEERKESKDGIQSAPITSAGEGERVAEGEGQAILLPGGIRRDGQDDAGEASGGRD